MQMEKEFLVKMGERIALKRKENKLTQEQLAEKVGVSLQTISNIEGGKKAARPENIVKISIVLGITTDYILTGKKTVNQLKGITESISNLEEEEYLAIQKIIMLFIKQKASYK